MSKGFKEVNLHGCVSGKLEVPVIGENGNWFIGNDDTNIPATGADGEPGPMGPQGIKGDKGEQGNIGPAGPQGIQGIQGEKGDKGETGPQGTQGIQGEKGNKGETGPQGTQGIQGEKGDKGETGPQGIQGIQGEKGDKGETGPQGMQGIQGDKGDKGETGLQGIQGIQGDKGEQGTKGDRGDTGATGIQGPKGDKGDLGPQGPIGATPSLAANLTTTAAGKALDATMGKVLDDKCSQINSNLSANVSAITGSWLGNNKISFDGNYFYATAANGVKKKLGELMPDSITIKSLCQSGDPNVSNYGILYLDANLLKAYKFMNISWANTSKNEPYCTFNGTTVTGRYSLTAGSIFATAVLAGNSVELNYGVRRGGYYECQNITVVLSMS